MDLPARKLRGGSGSAQGDLTVKLLERVGWARSLAAPSPQTQLMGDFAHARTRMVPQRVGKFVRDSSKLHVHSRRICPPYEIKEKEQMSNHQDGAALALAAELQSIFEQSHPRFSEAEYKRRHEALAGVMERAGVDHLLIVSAQNVGNATRWVTGWPGTNEALTIFRPGAAMTMYVEYYNHVPQARMIARGVEVRWGEEKGIVKASEELAWRGAKRIGVIGPLTGPKWKALENAFELVGLDGEYIKLRIEKSDEEIAWLRIGAALSDAGMAALITGTKPGMSEHELDNMI